MTAPPPPCKRCQAAAVWSGGLCWTCHRQYAADLRADPYASIGLIRGIVVGLAAVIGAIGAGAPGFVAIAIVPIAMAFGSHASRKHHRNWIQRNGPAIPQARLLAGPRAPSDSER